MKKLDIMNMRKDEEWNIVNGKTQRVEKVKVTGPTVTNAIKEVEIKEAVKPIILKRKKVIKSKKEKI